MILIIDDDAAVRSSLTFLLKRAGFRPEAVPGPKEALEVVRATAPELILMDMNFTLTTTGEEGIQLLKQVKIFRPDVPVILMTAWDRFLWPCRECKPAPSILLRSLGITWCY